MSPGRPLPPARGHYSYDLYREDEVARDFDRDRFGGPVGEYLAAGHAELVLRLLGPVAGVSVLDAGGGTGRLALALARAGARVSLSDASPAMLAVARAKLAAAGGGVPLARADVHALPFADRAFEAVVCSRVLMHVVDWRCALAELARVAAGRLLVDFPPLSGLTLAAPLVLPLRRRLAPRTQVYRVLGVGEVKAELARHGFSVRAAERQLCLPFFVHRRLARPAWSRRIEAALAGLGLTGRVGAPVVLLAERRPAPD